MAVARVIASRRPGRTGPPPASRYDWTERNYAVTRSAGQLLVGLVLYAASIAMVVHADLGSMPWDVLTQGIVAAHRAVVRAR